MNEVGGLSRFQYGVRGACNQLCHIKNSKVLFQHVYVTFRSDYTILIINKLPLIPWSRSALAPMRLPYHCTWWGATPWIVCKVNQTKSQNQTLDRTRKLTKHTCRLRQLVRKTDQVTERAHRLWLHCLEAAERCCSSSDGLRKSKVQKGIMITIKPDRG